MPSSQARGVSATVLQCHQRRDLRSSITFRRRASHYYRSSPFAFGSPAKTHTYHPHHPSPVMARRRKNRTHLKGGVASNPGAAEGVPKSFVIKHGQVGTSLTQLVRDVRRVMEPYTASRLKVSLILEYGLNTAELMCKRRNVHATS